MPQEPRNPGTSQHRIPRACQRRSSWDRFWPSLNFSSILSIGISKAMSRSIRSISLIYELFRITLKSMASRSPAKEPAPPPLPTDAEIAILAVLWRQGASTVREVHEALGKDSGYTTTLKLMQLMFQKGLVVRNERYRSHLYEARAPKEQTQRQIAGDLLKRAFEGSAKSLALGALAAQPASGKDLAEIRSLLDEFEKRRGKK